MRTRTGPAARRVVPRRFFPYLFSLLVILPVGTLAVLAATGPNAPSPAQGHAEVIAHGVVPLPPGQASWRVESASAALPDKAGALKRSLGFVLADKDAILLTDAATGNKTRLAAGEAMLVREQTVQTRSSLGTSPTTYYALELLPADAPTDPAADSRLVFASSGFATPLGDHDLDLVRDVLKPDETGRLADPGTPILVLVTSGTARITPSTSTETTTLESGEAALLSGALTITPTGNANMTYVAAVIGPEITTPTVTPTTPTPIPTVTPPNGTADAVVLACPVGEDLAAASDQMLHNDCTRPLQGVTVHYRTSGTDLAQATNANGRAGFFDLLPNTIDFVEDIPHGYQLVRVVCSFSYPAQTDGTPAGSGTADGDPGRGGLIAHDFRQGENLTCAFYNLTLPTPTPTLTPTPRPSPTPTRTPSPTPTLTPSPSPSPSPTPSGTPVTSGTVSFMVANCPPGMNDTNVLPDLCRTVTTGFDVTLTSKDKSVELNLKDASLDRRTDVFTWTNVPFQPKGSGYDLAETSLPQGYSVYFIRGAGKPIGGGAINFDLTPAAPRVQVEIDNSSAGPTGSITVNTFTCSAGMTARTLQADQCTPVDSGFDLSILHRHVGATSGVTFGLDKAKETQTGSFVWSGLAFASYQISAKAPQGYTSAVIDGVAGDPLSTDFGLWPRVTIDQTTPDVTVSLYFFQTAS
jgi:hypothetical protein